MSRFSKSGNKRVRRWAEAKRIAAAELAYHSSVASREADSMRGAGVTGMWENSYSHSMLAVDWQLKNEWDAPTVGLVLCRDGNRTVVEYALSVTDKLEAA